MHLSSAPSHQDHLYPESNPESNPDHRNIKMCKYKGEKLAPVTAFMKLNIDFDFHLLHSHASGKASAQALQIPSGIVFLRFVWMACHQGTHLSSLEWMGTWPPS